MSNGHFQNLHIHLMLYLKINGCLETIGIVIKFRNAVGQIFLTDSDAV